VEPDLLESHISEVTVGDLTIAFDSVGEGSPPLVLVHGFTGARSDFESVREPLAQGRRVISFDNRGHGDTTNPTDSSTYNFDQLVADLAGFLDEVTDSPVHLLGHSMGGMIAMRFALEHPDKLASLVLMDTSAASPDMPIEFTDEIAEMIFGPVREGGLDAFRKWSSSRESPERDLFIATKGKDWLDRNEDERYAVLDPNVVLVMGPQVFGHKSVLDRLSSLTMPTTIIVGSNDVAFVEPSKAMSEVINDSELVIIEGAYHSPQHTHLDEWVAVVEAHLSRTGRS
jgi:pimeloyl-ACP methyl ester carboxylesterase